jgi:hypothetical protein
MNQLIQPILKLSIISAILFAVSFLYAQYAPAESVSINLLLIVPFFYVVNLLFIFIHYYLKKKSGSYVKLHYLIISASRLIIYMIILILYGYFVRHDVVPFFISFMVFYLIYTILDVNSSIKVLAR